VNRAVVVSIANQKLSVRSGGQEGYVREVAEFVNDKIREVMERTKTASTLTASLLACMNIADEMLRSKGEREIIEGRAMKKVRDLISMTAPRDHRHRLRAPHGPAPSS